MAYSTADKRRMDLVLPIDNVAPRPSRLCSLCRILVLPPPQAQDPDNWTAKLGTARHILKKSKKGCSLCRVVNSSLCLTALTLSNPSLEVNVELVAEELSKRNVADPGRLKLRLSGPTQSYDLLSHDPRLYVNFYNSNGSLHNNSESDKMRKYPKNPGEADFFLWAKQRLQDCVENHECANDVEVALPTRIINVGDAVKKPKLYVPPPGRKGKYVALSYCWGSAHNFTTSHATIDSHKKGFDTKNLPRTLLDAFRVTRELGFQYLWVDALCILQGQDDEARVDWATESSKMDSIYANAYVTISASCASQCSDGFLHQRRTTIPYSIRNNDKKEDLASNGYLTLWPSPRDLNHEPINRRAWTLQEHILPPRLLSFTRADTSWRCGRVLGCEFADLNGAPLDPHDLISNETPRIGLTRQYLPNWSEIIKNFCSRHLTTPDDKFPAISGLARLHHQVRGGQYLAGLWDITLAHDLLWQPAFRSLFRIDSIVTPCIKPSVPASYRAPSWSWASMDGSILYRYTTENFRPLASLVDWKIDLINPNDPFGKVRAGYLSLSGRILPVRIEENIGYLERARDGKQEDNIGNLRQDLFVLDGDQRTQIGLATFDQSISKNLKLYGLLVLRELDTEGEHVMDVGLVLSTVGKLDEYRRVGIFYMESDRGRWFAEKYHSEIWFERDCMKTVRIV